MTNGPKYPPTSPHHQTPGQERTFQRMLKDLCNDTNDLQRRAIEEGALEDYNLSPEQKIAVIKVGHATGKYTMMPNAGGNCCCCGPDDMIKTSPAALWEGNLGPLTPLAGTWKGRDGIDKAPSEDGTPRITEYREEIIFEPIGPVKNGPQVLYGLELSKKVWRKDNDKLFHEEVGYWLWDFQKKQVMRCFIVPRGISVIAGGTVEPDAKEFKLSAKVGSRTYGICSNKFLDQMRPTVSFDLTVTIHDDQSFSYYQDTQLKIKDQADNIHHTDKNTLFRCK